MIDGLMVENGCFASLKCFTSIARIKLYISARPASTPQLIKMTIMIASCLFFNLCRFKIWDDTS